MPDKRVKDEALGRMLEMVREEEQVGDLTVKGPDAVVCQRCGHLIDVVTGEDLGEAVDMDQDVEMSDEADVYDVEG